MLQLFIIWFTAMAVRGGIIAIIVIIILNHTQNSFLPLNQKSTTHRI